jgi:uncharacterized membrane protein
VHYGVKGKGKQEIWFGALWLGHSLVTEYLQRADAILMRLNLLLLLVVSFLPFPTRLLAEYLSSDHAELERTR